MTGEARNALETLGFFSQLAFGGTVLGIIAGIVLIRFLHLFQFDIVGQITLTVVGAYGTFVIAEATGLHLSGSRRQVLLHVPSQVYTDVGVHVCGCSCVCGPGVLAVVALGVALAASGRTAVEEHETMHHFWEMVEYFANTLVFVISGMVIYEKGFARVGVLMS